MPREIITMQCGECKERNYSTTKNRKTTPDRIELKMFCRRCRKHTPHKEVKWSGVGSQESAGFAES